MKTKVKTKCRIFRSALPLLLVLLAFLAFYYFGPYRLCAVVSGSMEPNLPTWSLCVVNVKTPYESLQVGDIVVYNRMRDSMRIIHRVKEITDEGIVTKGDANAVDDGVSVTPDNLYGKSLFHIPKVGKLSQWVRSPVGIVVVVALFGALLFLPDGKKKSDEPERETEAP